ncbi:uncharacterized protein LOC130379981 isoform X2 [Gadus chalcogrammus]|nr:uncharacterized protein LOC130379981 isoform X2 [Gadus chalcogrammus]
MGRGRTKSPSSLGPAQPQQRALRSRRRESAMSSEKQTKHNPPEALPPCPPQPAPPGPTQEPAPTSGWAGPGMDGAVKESDGETSGLTSSLKTTTLSQHNPDNREDSMEVEDQSLTSSTCMDGNTMHDNMDLSGALTEVGEGGEAEGFETLYPTGRMEEEEDATEHQTSDPECSAEDRESGTEPVEGMLSRKRKRKRKRMGVCVLTEKERSHFLKKHENEKLQNEAEEKRVGDTGRTGDSDVELEEDPDEESHSEAEEGWVVSVLNSPVTQGIKVGPLTEQSELEEEPAPPTGGAGDSSSEAACEEGSDAVRPTDPVRSEENDPRARASKDCGRGPLSDREARLLMEMAGRKDEPEKQENVKEAVAEPHRAPTQVPSSVNIGLTESQREEVQTPQQPTESSATTGGLSETQGSQPSHSLMDTGLGRSEPIGTPPGPAAAAPSGGEENGNSGPLEEVDIAASPAPQPLLARATPDLVGFGPFDYISDSQLQDISLMEAQGGGPPSLEDASAQVRGLCQELSYLNRIVMATQRKVELFRRGNRGPKAH